MKRSTTAVGEPQEAPPRDMTVTMYKIQGVVEYCDAKGIQYFKRDVFRVFGVSPRVGYEMLRGNLPQRHSKKPKVEETRGRKHIISNEQRHKMDQILQDAGTAVRAITWEQLGHEAGVEASGRTISREMGTMDYRRCIVCRQGWVSQSTAERRMQHARLMLERYPRPEDWDCVRFTDEIHFGYGPHGLRIIRQPGERYCCDCVQYKDEPKGKDEKTFHCWVAVGYNFKSPIYFYDPGTINGKFSQQAYIDQILDPIVKPWLETGQQFVLAEAEDSGHGSTKHNIVRTWKDTHNLPYFFNCASSPDLSPVENCCLPLKEHVRDPSWDDTTVKGLIYEWWTAASQEHVNQQVRSMPDRLRAVLATGGGLTGY